MIAALFGVAMFCAPLVAAIPSYATAPALILVGALMCGSVAKVRWDDFSEAVPAFLTLVCTPLTFSIATGLSLGHAFFYFHKTFHRQISRDQPADLGAERSVSSPVCIPRPASSRIPWYAPPLESSCLNTARCKRSGKLRHDRNLKNGPHKSNFDRISPPSFLA